MSTAKWIWVAVLVVVVVVVGLWWAGVFNSNQASQSAAVVNSQPTDQGLSSSIIKSDVAKIDAQIALANAPLPASATKAQISATAGAINSAIVLMRALANKFQVMTVNAKTTGSPMPNARALADLSTQLSNAGSQGATANNNAMATSSSATTLKAAVGYIQSAQTGIVAARADISTILSGLGIK